MPKELLPSSFECDCGFQLHFCENTVAEMKAMSRRKRVSLADSERGGHVVVFDGGYMTAVVCPRRKSARRRNTGKRRTGEENPMPQAADPRVPTSLQHEVDEMLKLTGPFCAEHLDEEYGQLVRKLVAKLARKRPSPLERGDLRIWAATAIYVVGANNFLFDRTQKPHMTGDQLSSLTGVPKSTLANKSKLVRDVLRLRQYDPEFCKRDVLGNHPYAWLISVNGLIVDARSMPPEVQEIARRKGLIPGLSAK